VNFLEFKSFVETHNGPVQRDGKDWRGRCPACHDDGSRGNLTFREGDDGRVLIKCWSGCKIESILAGFGLTAQDLFAGPGNGKRHASRPGQQARKQRPTTTYLSVEAAGVAIAKRLHGQFTERWTYHNPDGTESFWVLRFDGCKTLGGEKTYRPVHREGTGYVEGDPPGPLPLYNLLELLARPTEWVFLCEGEKAADAARSIGLLATASAHGAKSADMTDWSPLTGRVVISLPDNDRDGEKYAADVTVVLFRLHPPAQVRIVRLPGLPPKGDIYNWIEEHDAVEVEGLRAQILAMAEAAKPEVAGSDGETDAVPSRKIVVLSASTFLQTPAPEPDQVLKNTLDAGDKGVVIGPSKVRKSFYLLQFMESLAAGRDFLGWSVPTARLVVGVQFEIQGYHFHRRVRRMAAGLGLAPADLGDRLQIVNARGLGLCGAAGIRAIREAVQSFQPDVICLDPLYKLLDGKENAAEDLKITLNLFDELAEMTGAAVVYVHHDAKGFSGDRDIRDRGAGSNVLGRDYDTCITLTPHASEPNAVVVETLLRNYPPQEAFTTKWVEDTTTGGYYFAVTDLAPTKRTSANAKAKDDTPFDAHLPIALSLLKDGPQNITEFRDLLQEKTGMKRERCRQFVRWLLTKPNDPLDIFEPRSRGQHGKWIGTTDQLAKKKAEDRSGE
jgi:hypothetical protein